MDEYKVDYRFTPLPNNARALLTPNAYMLLSYLIDEWHKADYRPFDAANAYFEYVMGITSKTLTKAIRELEYYCLIDRQSVGKGHGKIKATWTVLTENFKFWEKVPYSNMMKIKDEFSKEKIPTKTDVFNDDNLVVKKSLQNSREYFPTKKNNIKKNNLDNKLDNKEEKLKEEKNKLVVLTDFDNNFISPSEDMLTASSEDKGTVGMIASTTVESLRRMKEKDCILRLREMALIACKHNIKNLEWCSNLLSIASKGVDAEEIKKDILSTVEDIPKCSDAAYLNILSTLNRYSGNKIKNPKTVKVPASALPAVKAKEGCPPAA